MKTLTLLLFFICYSNYAQDPRPAIDKILNHLDNKGLNNTLLTDRTQTFKEFRSFLRLLSKQALIEDSFSGKFTFGFNTSNSDKRELIQFNVGAEVKKGSFPSQFKFKSDLNVQLQNGELIENISNLSVSYDHHLNNSFGQEGYIFIQRSSNNFLNIDQRYEAGIGFVHNVFISGRKSYKGGDVKKRLTQDGAKTIEKLNKFKIQNKTIETDDFIAILCTDSLCIPTTFSEKDIDLFTKENDKLLKAIRKRESKVRFSILSGINYEVERTPDSLSISFKDSDSTQFFRPRNLMRLAGAPNLELKINQVNFESKCYFKLGISNNDLNDEVQFTDQNGRFYEDIKTDFRIEWSNSLSIKITDQIGLKGTFNWTHINAPRRKYINLSEDLVTPDVQLFSSPTRFSNFVMSLSYKL